MNPPTGSHSRQRPRSTAKLTAALACCALMASRAAAYDADGHNAICDSGLAGHGFSPESIESIKEHDVGVDESDGAGAAPGLVNENYAPEHHFDRNPGMTDVGAFKLGAEWLRELRDAATNAILRCTQIGVDAALLYIGKALHAIQDFYSHSNYVELTDAEQDQVDAAFDDPNAPLPDNLKLTGFSPAPSSLTYYGQVEEAYNPPGDSYPHGLYFGNHKDKPDTYGDGGTSITRGDTTKTAYEWATAEAIRHTSEFIDSIYNSEGIADKWAKKFGTNLIASYVAPSNYLGGVRQSVGPGGGSMQDTNGTVLNLPPGCITTQLYMRILTPKMSVAPACMASSIPDGRIVSLREFHMSSGNLSAPVSAAMTYCPSEIAGLCETSLTVYAWNAYTPCGQGEWFPVPTTANPATHTVYFQVNHFSTYALYGPFLDGDSDGMSDSWEIMHFGSTNLSNGATDTDNDGMNDALEFKCDTNPTNKTSYLAISNITCEVGGLRIAWHGGSTVTQRVERTTNLVTGPWVPVYTNLPPTPTSASWADAKGTKYPDVYYRISVPGSR